ncbi:hypothetical protein Nwi_0569 [Nitrobacter winogradskyi Nb-255]|uniref:Uncharacterized protein n=1 Tax=Nitrobacter winogradskyi (strain ATCC 25391 / DSM 10237 / CIP 104748 / NCIMB 11846 / Nb-255) TaxID=323098 RepID=Q3SV55_NITWN|nr:hypothetical protein Nwi_0569 [Nitrobacter winogradskyi Nb-255]
MVARRGIREPQSRSYAARFHTEVGPARSHLQDGMERATFRAGIPVRCVSIDCASRSGGEFSGVNYIPPKLFLIEPDGNDPSLRETLRGYGPFVQILRNQRP